MEDEDNSTSTAGGVIGLIILILVGWWAYNTWFKSVEYKAFFYPELSNLDFFYEKNVESAEECRDWVNAQAFSDIDGSWDYECGTNCELQNDFTGRYYICEETFE